MKIRLFRIFQVVAVILLFLSSTAHVFAIEPVAFPKFTVQGVGNTPVPSGQLSRDHRWILVYLGRDCHHCDDLLHALEMFKSPKLSGRIAILIGGGTSGDSRTLIGSHEKIASLGWYGDPDWQAYKALSVSGMPVVFGIRDGIIEWGLAGTPWNSSTMNSVLQDWVTY